jgi:hypothetical protein
MSLPESLQAGGLRLENQAFIPAFAGRQVRL